MAPGVQLELALSVEACALLWARAEFVPVCGEDFADRMQQLADEATSLAVHGRADAVAGEA